MKIQTLKKPNYILVVEVAKVKGFIVSYEFNYEKAKQFLNQLQDRFCTMSEDEIMKQLPHLYSYELYPNSSYLLKDKYSASNGILTFSVVQVNSNFNPHWFIKERQNCPFLLGYFEMSRYAQLFEEIAFFVN